ncbi:MAG: TolC family protein [Thermoanaerobaculia bacterium]
MKRLLIAALLFASCASSKNLAPEEVGPSTSPSPAQAWTPPASAIPPRVEEPAPALPAGITPASTVSLAQVIDIALANNPETRIAWLSARSAESALGSARSAYLPEIDVNAQVGNARVTSQGGQTITTQTTSTASLALTYLLFDFGGREAQVEQARQTLIAADFTHNQAIQNVILNVQQAYYGLLATKALLNAENAALKERQTNLDAAEERHRAGVATIADVLQARTSLSQAQLNYETLDGNLRAFEGALANAIGLPATATFDFGELPLDIPANRVMGDVDALIARAVTERPDLAAARSVAQRTRARIREVRAQGLPSIVANASAGDTEFGSFDRNVSPYSASIGLRFPLFTGFRNTYDLREAETQAQIAVEDARSLQQRVTLDVWTSYYGVQTAMQRVTTSRDLLTSAQQSVDAELGRYRAGVGSIIELLTAEAALESARAQEVQARTDWFLSIAQLAHATGTLER